MGIQPRDLPDESESAPDSLETATDSLEDEDMEALALASILAGF